MSQKPSKNEISRPKSALDAVVNQLVRASVGGVPSAIPDEDLDKYVADLILKEAAAKNKQYNKEGVRAYLPHTGTPPCNLPKTNKRFLFNVVKNVDDHNQALIRKTEEEAAARRRALNRKDRSRRYDSDDERRYSSSRRSDRERTSRNDSYRREDVYRSSRYYSEDDIDSNTSSGERGRKLSHKEEYHSRKYSSRSPPSRTKSVSSSSSLHFDKTSSRLDNNDNSKVSSTLRKERTNISIDNNQSTSKINVIKKGRGEVSNGSKMDKYFRKDYNPMFDVEPFLGETGWFNYDEFEQSLAEKSLDDDSKKKKKKHKEKSKHKKEKHKSSSSSNNKSKKKRRRDDTDSEISSSDLEDHKKYRKNDDNDTKPIIYESVREWDKPKLSSSGSWDPDKTI